MSYEDLMNRIYDELPHLRGQLAPPQAVYVRARNKLYITFHSMTLVEEKTFLRMEQLLREAFPGRPLALRVVSPGLAEDFQANIGAYKQVLVDFLCRNYPGAVAWMPGIDWRCSGDVVTLTFPDAFSREYMTRQNAAARLSQVI